MIQENLTQRKSRLVSELEKLRAYYQADRENATSRPGAPIDEMIEHVKVLESPLLFKAAISDSIYNYNDNKSDRGMDLQPLINWIKLF